MKIANLIITLLVVVVPSIVLACTPGGATIGNFQTEQDDACYYIDEYTEKNNCVEPVRVVFDAQLPNNPELLRPLLKNEAVFRSRTISNEPYCYPNACKHEVTFIVGPEDRVIDENYKTNPNFTVFTYTYEIQGIHPDEVGECREFEEHTDGINKKQRPTETENDKQTAGCGSVHHRQVHLVWLLLLGLFAWLNRQNAENGR